MQCIEWNGIACDGGGLEVLSMLQLLEGSENAPATNLMHDILQKCKSGKCRVGGGIIFYMLAKINWDVSSYTLFTSPIYQIPTTLDVHYGTPRGEVAQPRTTMDQVTEVGRREREWVRESDADNTAD